MSGRRLAWGLAAGALYLGLVALAVGPLGYPVRPLLDGLAPPIPYRWVSPPEDLAATNQPPLEGETVLQLTDEGSQPLSALTADAQAQATFPGEVFPPREDARAVEVTIVPLDPAGLGPPPEGLEIDGNAYRVAAEYRPTGDPAEPDGPVTVVLRYPRHATVVLRQTDGGWEELETTPVPASMAVVGSTEELGVFAAATDEPARGFPVLLLVILAALAAVGGAVVGYLARPGRRGGDRAERRRRARRRSSPRRT